MEQNIVIAGFSKVCWFFFKFGRNGVEVEQNLAYGLTKILIFEVRVTIFDL